MGFLQYNLNSSNQKSPFSLGMSYRVVRPAPSYEGELVAGEDLKYFGMSYSHYDGMTVYVFTTREGDERTWVRRDEEPYESWRGVFEPVGDAG